MIFLLICALILFFVRAIRSKDTFDMVFAIVALGLFLLHCLGMIHLPACLTT